MKLAELLKTCRENGVSSVSADTEDAGRVTANLDAPVPEVPAPLAQVAEPPRGRDGLTADEQMELYGHPMSDTQ